MAHENLRTSGLPVPGRIKYGRPIENALGVTPFSSTPTQFERNATSRRTAAKGFGSQTYRHFGAHTHSLPGPGAYFHPSNLVRTGESVSKKGYGGLMVGAQRWQHSAPAWTGPGPGEYEGSGHAGIARPPSRNTANFALHTVVAGAEAPLLRDPSGLIGPGSYESMASHHSGARVTWTGAPNGGQVSAFKAVSRKPMTIGAADSPPPGQYNLSKDWRRGEQRKSHFKNHSARDIASCGPAPPNLIYPGEESTAATSGRAPGPGTYDLQDVLGVHRAIEQRFERQSAAFRPAIKADRFGAPTDASAHLCVPPGPGAYDSSPCKAALDPSKAVAAPFVSKASKSALLEEKLFRGMPPGPAYYNPNKPTAKTASFHLNKRNVYM